MRFSRRLPIAATGLCILTFLIWWNYAALSWSSRGVRLAARGWYWRDFGDPFEQLRRTIAGFNLVDCSYSVANEYAASNCVSAAIRANRNFQLRKRWCGIDSCGVEGIVGTNEVAYEIDFDLRNGFVTVWRRKCPTPLRITTSWGSWSNEIHCMPLPRANSEIEILCDDWAEKGK
jgi:hypothetical protein